MSIVLRSFPEISRVGHQETQWSQPIPAGIVYLELQGIASDAVLSDEANSIDFTISVSPDGTDANPLNKILNSQPWRGGFYLTHQQVLIPNPIGVNFGPLTQYVGWSAKLAVDIPNAMVVGGTLLGQDANHS